MKLISIFENNMILTLLIFFSVILHFEYYQKHLPFTNISNLTIDYLITSCRFNRTMDYQSRSPAPKTAGSPANLYLFKVNKRNSRERCETLYVKT